MVEAAIQEADEDFGIDWNITSTDDMFVGGFEDAHSQPAVVEVLANAEVQAVENGF